jgi:4-hydroxybenzoate polyprenyltransferase
LSTKIQQLTRLKSIFLLSRPINLFIVGVTMYITRYVVLNDALHKGFSGELPIKNLHFALLVAAAMMITAAGNIINDYFDQKVDRINKPDRIIVGKTVSRRGAILLHQLLNATSVFFVGIVCYAYQFWSPIIIPIIIITLLWWYSPVLKKKPLAGNFLVAICTALVPVFAGVFDVQLLARELSMIEIGSISLYQYTWLWIVTIAAFAFVLTIIREAVKDAQDIPGDRAADYQTLPIVWGIDRTRNYVYAWMFVFALMTAMCMTRLEQAMDLALFAVLLVAPLSMALLRLRNARQSSDFGRVSYWIKVLMLGGLLLMLLLL